MRGYFEVQIAEGNVHSLKCAELKCTSLASSELIESLVTEELYSQYNKLMLDSVLSAMGDIVSRRSIKLLQLF